MRIDFGRWGYPHARWNAPRALSNHNGTYGVPFPLA
jgi:hypothetical protein